MRDLRPTGLPRCAIYARPSHGPCPDLLLRCKKNPLSAIALSVHRVDKKVTGSVGAIQEVMVILLYWVPLLRHLL